MTLSTANHSPYNKTCGAIRNNSLGVGAPVIGAPLMRSSGVMIMVFVLVHDQQQSPTNARISSIGLAVLTKQSVQ
jgi:hypothetical protein